MKLEPDEVEFLAQVPLLLADVASFADDPAAARLEVPVYLDDAEANTDWWRLMKGELVSSRNADRSAFALLVEAAAEGTVASRLEAEAFLRVLVEGRLALGARLGVDTDDDYEKLDPADLGALDYLAQMQVLLLACLDLPDA
jgi:hypothetical protein